MKIDTLCNICKNDCKIKSESAMVSYCPNHKPKGDK